MCCPPQGKLVLFWIDVLEHRPRHKHTQSTLISGTWLDVTRQLPTLLFGKPKTITVSHNRQRWEQRRAWHLPRANTTKTAPHPPPSPNPPPPKKKKKKKKNAPVSALCPGDVCQDGLHTKNKQASHCNSKRNGCGFGRGGRQREEGWDGMERRGGEREAGYTRRGGGREGGGVWGKRVKVVIKTTIIRSLSATQWPHQGWCNDRLCWTHVRLSEGVCACVCVCVCERVCALLSVLKNGLVSRVILFSIWTHAQYIIQATKQHSEGTECTHAAFNLDYAVLSTRSESVGTCTLLLRHK